MDVRRFAARPGGVTRRRVLLAVATLLAVNGLVAVSVSGKQERVAATPTATEPVPPVRPVYVDIPQLLVSAPVESVFVVNGAMESPPGAFILGWYEQGGQLGRPGNVIMSGYFDYWGVGPGIFYTLDELNTGSHIDVTGTDGAVYRYRVSSVTAYDLATAPIEKILGITKEQSLTLFTSAGDFDYEANAYTGVLVVRATRADEPPVLPDVTPIPEIIAERCSVQRSVEAFAAAANSSPNARPESVATRIAGDDWSNAVEAETTVVAEIDAALHAVTRCISMRMAMTFADGTVWAVVGPADPLGSRRHDWRIALRRQDGAWRVLSSSPAHRAERGPSRLPPLRPG